MGSGKGPARDALESRSQRQKRRQIREVAQAAASNGARTARSARPCATARRWGAPTETRRWIAVLSTPLGVHSGPPRPPRWLGYRREHCVVQGHRRRTAEKAKARRLRPSGEDVAPFTERVPHPQRCGCQPFFRPPFRCLVMSERIPNSAAPLPQTLASSAWIPQNTAVLSSSCDPGGLKPLLVVPNRCRGRKRPAKTDRTGRNRTGHTSAQRGVVRTDTVTGPQSALHGVMRIDGGTSPQ